MSKRDYYEVLGVDKNVGDNDLKAAYRKLAMANHPDRNQGDSAAEERFREASEAYEILKDPQKRSAYDRMAMPLLNRRKGAVLVLEASEAGALVVVSPTFLIKCFLNFPAAPLRDNEIVGEMISVTT